MKVRPTNGDKRINRTYLVDVTVGAGQLGANDPPARLAAALSPTVCRDTRLTAGTPPTVWSGAYLLSLEATLVLLMTLLITALKIGGFFGVCWAAYALISRDVDCPSTRLSSAFGIVGGVVLVGTAVQRGLPVGRCRPCSRCGLALRRPRPCDRRPAGSPELDAAVDKLLACQRATEAAGAGDTCILDTSP